MTTEVGTLIGAVAAIVGVMSALVSALVISFTVGRKLGGILGALKSIEGETKANRTAIDASQVEVKRAYESQVRFNGDMRSITSRIDADVRSMEARISRTEQRLDRVEQRRAMGGSS